MKWCLRCRTCWRSPGRSPTGEGGGPGHGEPKRTVNRTRGRLRPEDAEPGSGHGEATKRSGNLPSSEQFSHVRLKDQIFSWTHSLPCAWDPGTWHGAGSQRRVTGAGDGEAAARGLPSRVRLGPLPTSRVPCGHRSAAPRGLSTATSAPSTRTSRRHSWTASRFHTLKWASWHCTRPRELSRSPFAYTNPLFLRPGPFTCTRPPAATRRDAPGRWLTAPPGRPGSSPRLRSARPEGMES